MFISPLQSLAQFLLHTLPGDGNDKRKDRQSALGSHWEAGTQACTDPHKLTLTHTLNCLLHTDTSLRETFTTWIAKIATLKQEQDKQACSLSLSLSPNRSRPLCCCCCCCCFDIKCCSSHWHSLLSRSALLTAGQKSV